MLIRELVQQYNALSIDYQDAVLNLNNRAMQLMPFKPGITPTALVVEACEKFLVAHERFHSFVEQSVTSNEAVQPIQDFIANKHGV